MSQYRPNNLGVVASHVRKLKAGTEFANLFPKPEGTDPIVNKDATVHDTLRFVRKVVLDTLPDTAKVAPLLKRNTPVATMNAVFNFFYQHYQYKLDAYGIEQVRRPARAWQDRKTGIDCDCFATSVSSVLTNLRVPHYLKIIAINGRANYQHIYVVVPKYEGADINKRSSYWVIDPVLNNFDEEAPTITKTDYLQMEGIPLQYLNGIDDVAGIGLGSEFEGIEAELEGLGSTGDLGYRAFRRRMHKHVKNTLHKLNTSPQAVSTIYQPVVLRGMYERLDRAFDGNDAVLLGTLEELSNIEHQALTPTFAGLGDAIHGHDDYLYGAMFGDIDDNMISAVSGLGRKGRSKAKTNKAAKSGKRGVFTKIKNAVKKAKEVHKKLGQKAGKVLKKIGRIVVKTNPLALAARAGFLLAMRTNFAHIAEKAYWGYQTKDFALSKGIKADFHAKAVQLLDRIKKVFVKIGGNESALKKAIMNGRAAKKVAKKLNGLSGGSMPVSELSGINGLGSAIAAGASITAAMSFLTPIIANMKKLFKGVEGGAKVFKAAKGFFAKRKAKKNGEAAADSDASADGSADSGDTVQNENGTESPAPTTDPGEEINNTVRRAANPEDTTIDNDGSIEQADAANEESPVGVPMPADPDALKKGDDAEPKGKKGDDPYQVLNLKDGAKRGTMDNTRGKSDNDEDPDPEKKSGSGALLIGGTAIAALVIAKAMSGSKKSKPAPALGNIDDQPAVDGLAGVNKATKKTKKKVVKL